MKIMASTNTPTKKAWKIISKKPKGIIHYKYKGSFLIMERVQGIILMKKLKYKSELIKSMSYLAK